MAERPVPWDNTVTAFFTDRNFGVATGRYARGNIAFHVGDDPAAVTQNRKLVEARLGLPIVFMEPSHGSRDIYVTDVGQEVGGADILLTDSAIGLATQAADCVPVLAATTTGSWVAAAHIGWRGLVAGTATQLLTALTRHSGGAVTDIALQIGPAICGACYQVGGDVWEQVRQVAPTAALPPDQDGSFHVDIRAGLITEFQDRGLRMVALSASCTYSDHRYFSFRRDGVTGRFAGVVARKVPGVSYKN